MPTPFMCHECDSVTMNSDGICDNCVEPTTADEYNEEYYEQEKEGKTNNGRNGTSYRSITRSTEQYDRMDEKSSTETRISR